MRFLDRAGFATLVRTLTDIGYEVIGPTVRDGAIVLDRVEVPDDLPVGVRETQRPGGYGLESSGDDRLFLWAHGPDAAKRFLFPPREPIASIHRDGDGIRPSRQPIEDERPFAFVGLRACDLAAVAVQDRVFLELDPLYRHRRERALFIGVNCEAPAETCFCTSMATGPRCTAGFDLALTELAGGFVVEVGSARGEAVLAHLETREATAEETAAPERVTAAAAERISRRIDDVAEVPALLRRNAANPRWREIASRCLSCANCTMVCPTCFCHDVVDGVSLSGDLATRTREWASCFSEGYSWTAGEVVRHSREARYRQWLTHKFSTWVDQFGTSGCVGCGRCITWCPVGIDLTEEIAAIRARDGETELVAT